jgi:hypothetical protein
MSPVCTRPIVTTITIAGRTIARCTTCSQVSAPGDHDTWAQAHRGHGEAA